MRRVRPPNITKYTLPVGILSIKDAAVIMMMVAVIMVMNKNITHWYLVDISHHPSRE